MKGQEEEAVSLQGGGRGLNKKGMAERLMEARRAEARASRERPTQWRGPREIKAEGNERRAESEG
jgi:hypothetical protein